MFRRLALLAVLLCAPAFAASSLESVRAGAAAARERVSQVRTQQMTLRSELNGVAQRIEALKAQRKGKVLTGSELETALRRSQELSGELTGLAQTLATAEGEAQKQNVALLSALSQSLNETRKRFEQTQDRNTRRNLLESMRKLRAEREQVRAQLPATAVPALDGDRASDDPEDLLEQADLLRDNQDKARRELSALEARIREVREERELDRRMNDFLADDSMFDESDRRLRTQVTMPRGSPAADSSGSREAGASAPQQTNTPAAESSPGAGAPVGAGSPTPPVTPTTPPPPTAAPGESKGSFSDTGSAARANATGQPILGQGQDFRIGNEQLDDLGALEARRKRLSTLVDELGKRAQAMESKAKTLK